MRFTAAALFILFSSIFIFNSEANEVQKTLQEFETDGCTLFVEGPSDKPDLWAHCCFEHDLRYWFGGDKADKNFSDIELRECVRDVAGSFWANLMYNGVKAGGWSPIKFKYVWSWGWEPKRGKEKLSSEEASYIIERLKVLELEPEFRERFIHKYLGSAK